jgi:hypothetical protein
VIKTILRWPFDVTSRLLDTDSDWIRYGLPALILTIVLSIAMANKSEDSGSSSIPSSPKSAVSTKPAFPAFVPRSESPAGPVSGVPKDSGWSKPGTDPFAAVTQKREEAGNAGRNALCSAVATVLPDYKAGKLRRMQLVLIAREAYHGPNGPQAAAQSINKAMADYTTGAWSEADCPNSPALPKGTIGDVANRRYHPTN